MKLLHVSAIMIAGFLVAGQVHADAIIGFKKASLKIYTDQNGSGRKGTIKRNEIKFPARILTNRSAAGLIKATFEFSNADREPVSGWVRYRSVRVEEGVAIDVPGCAPRAKETATISLGVRGLGKGCK